MADERIHVQKRTWTTAGKVFLKSVFGGVLALFVYFSMTMIFSGLGTKNIGEEIYRYDENSVPQLIDTVYYDESRETASEESAEAPEESAEESAGETTSSEESEDDGTFVVYIRSEMSAGMEAAYQILSTLCMVLLLLCMPYADLWALGDKDNNNVTFGRLSEDTWRGFKIGLAAGIPGFVCFFLLILSKLGVMPDSFPVLYQWLNVPYILILKWLTGGVTSAQQLDAWRLIPIGLLTLLVPAICALGYYLGYKEFSLTEKFLYTSDKKKRRR